MAYYDFPHTRNYDTDLGYLIQCLKSLEKSYNTLNDNVLSLDKNIKSYIKEMVEGGLLYLDCTYNEDNEDITFKFAYNHSDEENDLNSIILQLEALNKEVQLHDYNIDNNSNNITNQVSQIKQLEIDMSNVIAQLENLIERVNNGGN